MSTDNLPKYVKVVDALKSSFGLLIIIGGGIVSCANAYYQLHELERNQKQDRDVVNSRFKASEERSDKRYEQVLELGKKHEEFGMYHEKRILELEKDNAYNKGLIDGLKLKK